MECTLPDAQSKHRVDAASAGNDDDNAASAQPGIAAVAGVDSSSTSSAENLFSDSKVRFMFVSRCWCQQCCMNYIIDAHFLC